MQFHLTPFLLTLFSPYWCLKLILFGRHSRSSFFHYISAVLHAFYIQYVFEISPLLHISPKLFLLHSVHHQTCCSVDATALVLP